MCKITTEGKLFAWAEDAHSEWCCGEGMCCCGHEQAREAARKVAEQMGEEYPFEDDVRVG